MRIIFLVQGILGLAYQRISKPDNMAPWLNSVHYLQKCNNIAFSLELCGHEGDKKTHYGHFILYGMFQNDDYF